MLRIWRLAPQSSAVPYRVEDYGLLRKEPPTHLPIHLPLNSNPKMASPQPQPDDLEAEVLEGQIIIRRFTDELTGANELERSTKAAQAEIDEEEKTEEQRRMKLLYESPANSSAS
jgi:hypothetical protein